jgi:hypothetical protein
MQPYHELAHGFLWQIRYAFNDFVEKKLGGLLALKEVHHFCLLGEQPLPQKDTFFELARIGYLTATIDGVGPQGFGVCQKSIILASLLQRVIKRRQRPDEWHIAVRGWAGASGGLIMGPHLISLLY